MHENCLIHYLCSWQVIKSSGLTLPESRFLLTEILLRFSLSIIGGEPRA
jgi:hypothetical protein